MDWWPSDSNNLFGHTANDGLKIFVSCEDSGTGGAAEPPDDDQVDVGLENLCLAVTEQALD